MSGRLSCDSMRELVYLSEAKLSQFLPEKPPWWSRLGRNAKLEVSAPVGKAGLDIGEPATKPTEARLAAVIAEIEKSAKWFDDPVVRPGEWVHFELSIGECGTDHQPASSAWVVSTSVRPARRD